MDILRSGRVESCGGGGGGGDAATGGSSGSLWSGIGSGFDIDMESEDVVESVDTLVLDLPKPETPRPLALSVYILPTASSESSL